MASNGPAPFIHKLRMIVDSGEAVRWKPDGTTFVVYDVPKFESEVLSKWFKSPHMASFVRQLNFYGFRKLTARGRSRDSATSKQWEFQHPMFLREDKAAANQIHRRTTADTEAIRSEGESMRLAVASLRNQLASVKKQLAEANSRLAAADAARRNAEQEAADLRRRLRPQATARGLDWIADPVSSGFDQATESAEDSLHTILRGVVDRKRRRVANSSTGAFTSSTDASGQDSIPLAIRAPQTMQPSSADAAWALGPVTVAPTPNPARDDGAMASSSSSSSSSLGPSGLAASFAGLRIATSDQLAAPAAPLSDIDTGFDDGPESPFAFASSSRPVLKRMPHRQQSSSARGGAATMDSMGDAASASDVASLGLQDEDTHRFGIVPTANSAATPAKSEQHLLAVAPLSRVGSDRSILSLASSAGSAGFAPTLGASSQQELAPESMPGSQYVMGSQPPMITRSSSVDSTGTDGFGRDGLGLSALGTFSSTTGFPSLQGPMAPPPSRTPRSSRSAASASTSAAAAAAAEAEAAASSLSSSSSGGNTDEVVSVARQVARMPRPEFAKTLSQIALAIVCSNQLGAIHSAPSAQPSSSTKQAASPDSPVAAEEAEGAALEVLRRFNPAEEAAAAAAAAAAVSPEAAAGEGSIAKPSDSSAAVVVAASRVMSSPDIKPADSQATQLPEELSHVPAELLLATLMRMKRVQSFVAAAATGLISAAAVSAAARGAAAAPPQSPAM